MHKLHVYTDGGSSPNPGRGGWAYIIQHRDKEYAGSGKIEWCTNNQAELQAVLSEIKFAIKFNLMEGYESMVIHTDSMYILKSASLWLEGWKRRGWVTAQKKTNGEVKNLDMWKEYDELKNAFHIEYVHVKGHSGDEYNEKCDSMVHKAMYK